MLNYLLLFVCLGSVYGEGGKRPNFVVILTDDQDTVLGSMSPMKKVHQFIAEEGLTFTNSYVTSPICCPSRASLLTGLYVHNHRTQNNSIQGGCYGPEWRQKEHRVFANAMQEVGYNTFYAGKYMNQYGTKAAGGPEVVPPGWTEWHGLVGNSVYYNYTVSNNGVPTYSTDLYLTDVIRDLSISYIENQTESQPFLMVLAPPAPHQPFTPAPRHQGLFSNVTAVRHPNFNVAVSVLAPPAPHQPFTPAPRHQGLFSNVTAVRHPNFNVAVNDKHWLMRMPPSPLPESMMPELDRVFRSRWEALLAVDELVADVVGALEVASLLDDTYVIYTSDNGYHIGQFSQVYDKRQPYEADIKVPLLIRGPGVKKNTKSSQPVLNIDIAPTILQLAGIEAVSMDGRPVDLVAEEAKERYMLMEYYGEAKDGTVDSRCPWKYDSDNLAECHLDYDCKCQDARNNTFACLRHIAERVNMKYCIFADNEKFAELYDLNADPFELHNAIDEEFQAIIVWYNNYLNQMLKCRGARNCDNPIEELAPSKKL